MLKKHFIIVNLCIILNSFQVQANSDNPAAAAGAGLFAFTAAAMTVRSWNKSHEKQVAATDIQKVIRGHQTRKTQKHEHLSATEIQKIARGYSDRQDYKKQFNTRKQQQRQNEFIKKAVMSSLSTTHASTKEEELFNKLYKKSEYSKTVNLVAPKIERKFQLNELETLMRLDDTTKVDQFFDKHLDIQTDVAPKKSFENIKNNKLNNIAISTKHTIAHKKPNESEYEKRIIWPIIHGTDATNSTSLGDDLKHPTTAAILRQGKYRAFKENADTELMIAKWNGIWKKDARIASGKKIGQLVTEEMLKDPKISKLVYLTGHSYGCDVGREAILEIDKIVGETSPESRENIHFKKAYCLASPPTKVNISHIMDEIHMYGGNDAVATAEAYRLSKHTSTDIHNSLARANILFPNDDHSTIKYNGVRYLHEIENITKDYLGETAFIVDISSEVPTITNSSNDEDEDGFYEANPQPDVPYKMINLIDIHRRNKDAHLDETLQEKHAKAHDEYKQIYPKKDPYVRATYAESLRREAETRGYTRHTMSKPIANAVIYGVGGLEYLLGNNSSSSAMPTTTISPQSSPTNSAEYKTPPSTPPNSSTETVTNTDSSSSEAQLENSAWSVLSEAATPEK